MSSVQIIKKRTIFFLENIFALVFLRKSCCFGIQFFEIDFSGVDWQEIIGNTKELGRDVDRMADGSSITHFVTIFFLML